MELGTAGLQEQPFGRESRPLTVVSYEAKQLALDFPDLIYTNANGLGVFRGPELSGKTTIIRHFTDTISEDTAIAVIDGANLDTSELLELVLSQFGYDLESSSLNELLGMLKVFVQQQAATGDPPLLIIENSHALNPTALDVLCELANVKVKHHSALRMILASDRCIQSIINAPAMECISSRLTGSFELGPLTLDETAGYVHAKMRAGGCFDPENVFPYAVCYELFTASSGWPGIIDKLALRALDAAPHCPIEIEHVERPRSPVALPTPIPIESAITRPSEPEAVATLFLTKDGKTLKEISLDDSRMMIGRSEHNDLTLNSKFISRHHALFVRQGPATFLMDLNSTNGTYVNSRKISNQVLIHEDVISVGNHGLKFVDPNASDRSVMEGIGFADTAVMRTLRDVRRMLAKENIDTFPAAEIDQLRQAQRD